MHNYNVSSDQGTTTSTLARERKLMSSCVCFDRLWTSPIDKDNKTGHKHSDKDPLKCHQSPSLINPYDSSSGTNTMWNCFCCRYLKTLIDQGSMHRFMHGHRWEKRSHYGFDLLPARRTGHVVSRGRECREAG